MVKEMCKATYRAEQIPGAVVIIATGEHHYPGYNVSFERVGVTVFPPQFSLMHQAPDKLGTKSLTPFTHRVEFEADQKVDNVVVYDANGRHIVEVCESTDKKPKVQA